MATAIMELIGEDHRASARKRMEWVGNLDLASQTPGIMTSPLDRGGLRAAVMYTLIGTAKLNDIDPQAPLADVLERIADHPIQRLPELLPWNWRPAAAALRQNAA